jgi:hypothetical protein
VSLVNPSKLILYKRETNMTVFCEFSESIDVDTVQKRDKWDSFVRLVNLSKLILYKREINRTVFCEFSESIEVDTVQ